MLVVNDGSDSSSSSGGGVGKVTSTRYAEERMRGREVSRSRAMVMSEDETVRRDGDGVLALPPLEPVKFTCYIVTLVVTMRYLLHPSVIIVLTEADIQGPATTTHKSPVDAA